MMPMRLLLLLLMLLHGIEDDDVGRSVGWRFFRLNSSRLAFERPFVSLGIRVPRVAWTNRGPGSVRSSDCLTADALVVCQVYVLSCESMLCWQKLCVYVRAKVGLISCLCLRLARVMLRLEFPLSLVTLSSRN